VLLDNAFSLIEGHPIFSNLKLSTLLEAPPLLCRAYRAWEQGAELFFESDFDSMIANCVEAKKDPPLRETNAQGWGTLRVLLRSGSERRRPRPTRRNGVWVTADFFEFEIEYIVGSAATFVPRLRRLEDAGIGTPSASALG
jgi:hypothetical protein